MGAGSKFALELAPEEQTESKDTATEIHLGLLD